MKFYIEILHPYESKVLWHYYVEAPSEAEARDFCGKKFMVEQYGDLLLDTGGFFMMTATEEK